MSLPPILTHAFESLSKFHPEKSELYFVRHVNTRIDSKNGKVESLTRSEDVGISVRLIQDKKIGFSFTTSLEKSAIDKAIESAVQIASLMPEDENVDLCSTEDHQYSTLIPPIDREGLDAPIQEKIKLSHDLESNCRAADKRITGIRAASIAEYFSEIYLVDSHGKFLRSENTLFTSSITCKAEEAGDSQIGSEFSFSHSLKNLDIKTVAELAARCATELLGASQGPTMKCPAVLKNTLVAELLEFLAPSFSAEEMDKGRSPLTGKLNELLFSKQVTLINDGLLAGGFASSSFDAEGIPSQQTHLIENGIFKNALYDVYYSNKFNTRPTGSSQRSIKTPPKTGISNFYMKAGQSSETLLLDGIDRGVYLTELMGLHTANPVTGDFSLGASGILIENGKLTKPMRGFAVAGNIFELLKNVTDVGSNLKFFGSVGAPSVRILEISISGA